MNWHHRLREQPVNMQNTSHGTMPMQNTSHGRHVIFVVHDYERIHKTIRVVDEALDGRVIILNSILLIIDFDVKFVI